MKKIVILLFTGFLGLALNAQEPTVKAQEPTAKIKFKSDVIDYGVVAKGSNGVRVFEFENTGNSPLVISKVNSSCGCTIPKKPDGPIAPGETSEIQVKYDTKRLGPIRKTITVNSNADTPTVALKIKGTVVEAEEEETPQ